LWTRVNAWSKWRPSRITALRDLKLRKPCFMFLLFPYPAVWPLANDLISVNFRLYLLGSSEILYVF
jgi:hypothetical protein